MVNRPYDIAHGVRSRRNHYFQEKSCNQPFRIKQGNITAGICFFHADSVPVLHVLLAI